MRTPLTPRWRMSSAAARAPVMPLRAGTSEYFWNVLFTLNCAHRLRARPGRANNRYRGSKNIDRGFNSSSGGLAARGRWLPGALTASRRAMFPSWIHHLAKPARRAGALAAGLAVTACGASNAALAPSAPSGSTAPESKGERAPREPLPADIVARSALPLHALVEGQKLAEPELW